MTTILFMAIGLIAILFLAFWLGSKHQKEDSLTQTINEVKRAKAISEDISKLSDADKRKRLRESIK